MTFFVITVAVIIGLAAMCLILTETQDEKNITFLKKYGWRVEPVCYERVNLTIPKEFDNVYKNYNDLQKNAGLDLENYKGIAAVRYTYAVINFPEKVDDTVYANVLCVEEKIIAGDIMTRPVDGFMVSLNYLKNGK